MKGSNWLWYALLAVLTGILVSLFVNLLFPVILNSRVLFGGAALLLLICGLVAAGISVRRMLHR